VSLPTRLPSSCALAFLTSLSAAWPAGQDSTAVEASSGSISPAREVLREEFFALELCPTAGPDPLEFLRAVRSDCELAGVAAWRRKRDATGQRVELDVSFPADGTRVLHVERLSAGGSKLVWRELRPGAGRTLTAAWEASARGLELLEWSGERRSRERVAAPAGAVLPLYLLELVRSGDVEAGRFALFDPLSKSIDSFEIAACYAGAAAQGVEPAQADAASFLLQRLVELRREDGTCAGRFLFCGEDLLAYQWQSGALRARRITAEEYESRLAEAPASVVLR